MLQPARQSDGATSRAPRFRNRIPAWIAGSELYVTAPGSKPRRLERTSRAVLEAIADHCDPPNDRGNLLGAFGPVHLARAAGVSLATFWRHVKRLEKLGFVVCLARGGVQGAKRDGPKRIISNTWGIPGAPGSLDHLRARRREQTMRPTGDHDARGRPIYAPDISASGAQATLWRREQQPTSAEAGYSAPGRIGTDAPQGDQRGAILTRPPPRFDTTPVSERHDGRVAVTHHQNHDHTRDVKNHGVAASAPRGDGGNPARTAGSGWGSKRPRKGSRATIRHIEDVSILSDTPRLLALLRQERARGATAATPVQWVAAAERAVRVTQREGGDARALFADLVNRERWLFLAEEDLARARQRLEANQLSQDARIALTAIQLAKRTGQNAFHLARNVRPGLTLQRWEALLAELRRHGHEEAQR